ncbi:10780_t:CDS:2 [Ambispora leptoticha]|uniref:10780_t:CDS:1 n=1 Tax=Ambispora leptoticha TaxID=144679 RepID=A0A9N9FLK0_9GLOM|nr:10780_t:CDS:2 [Ambispora leptoticha]
MHQAFLITLKQYILKDDCDLIKNEINRFSQVNNQVNIINKKDEHCDTLIHFAARHHAKNALKILVEFGGDVASVNIHGRQPLHEAIEDLECVQFLCRQPNIDVDSMKGRLQIVKELISKGANDKLLNKDGWNSLHLASKEGHLDVVKFLHEKSPESSLVPSNSGRLPIQTAALCNHREIVYYFLASSSQDSIKFLLSAKDNSGLNLLQNAVVSGNLELVQRLVVEYDVSITERDKLGRQTIHHAAMTGNVEVARFLMIRCCENEKNKNEKRVDFINSLDEWDMWTPLHYASKQGYEEMVKFLVEECGAKINPRDKLGRTPLDIGNNYCLNYEKFDSVYKNWRRKYTKGLSASMLFIWGLSSFIFGTYAITVELAIPLIVQQELYGILCLVCHVQCLYYKCENDKDEIVIIENGRAEQQPLMVPENGTMQYNSIQIAENKLDTREARLSGIRQAKYFTLFLLWILGFGFAQLFGVILLKVKILFKLRSLDYVTSLDKITFKFTELR